MTDEEKRDRKQLAYYLKDIHNCKYDNVIKAFFFGKACFFAERRFSTNMKTFNQWNRIKYKLWKELFKERIMNV